jgi:hypothetical protein
MNVFTISIPIHSLFEFQSCRLGSSLADLSDVPRTHMSVLTQSHASGARRFSPPHRCRGKNVACAGGGLIGLCF